MDTTTANSGINLSTPQSFARLPFTKESIAITASILIPLSIFGIVSNVMTIIVIAKSTKLKSIFNCLILSLCVSDLISALISPLFLYRRTWGFEGWKISTAICKVYFGTELLTSYVTTLHIFLFAAFRLISIRAPTLYYKLKIKHVKIIVGFVWFLCFVVGFIPFSLMFRAKDSKTPMTSKWPSCTLCLQWFKPFRYYTAIAYSIMFYVPMLFVIVISIYIISLLFKRRSRRQTIISFQAGSTDKCDTAEAKRRKKEMQVVLQLSLIVGSFLLGYVPHTAYHFFTSNTTLKQSYKAKVFDWWFAMAQHTCLRVSECLNPVFYNLASSKMRKETVSIFKRMWKSIRGRNISNPTLQSTRSRRISPVTSPDEIKLPNPRVFVT
uniref:adenosine receptor A2b-like n=1 Tax=Ciona intestinalis TaxID=7719 RepID=UPI000EF534C6|nr:adenosine receptor A2b-like [Ciona intestinalis]XP_026691640.1 adenosine receptor A2b-like [Ciona intestinalis]|eukprot:XP_018668991.2 adenosine receptor A2b-like [Ciona intestinalis]